MSGKQPFIIIPLGELNAWKILAWGFEGGRESSDEKQNETLTEAEVGTSHESDQSVVGRTHDHLRV